MATWRLWYIKVRREKALETWVCNLKCDWTSPGLQSDPKNNVAGSLGWLEILSQSTSFSSLRASLSAPSCIIREGLLIRLFFSQWFQMQLAFLQANAGWGAGGEATEEEKPLLYVLCMERKSYWCSHHVEGGGKEGTGPYTELVRNGNSKSGMECEIKPQNGNTLINGSEV